MSTVASSSALSLIRVSWRLSCTALRLAMSCSSVVALKSSMVARFSRRNSNTSPTRRCSCSTLRCIISMSCRESPLPSASWLTGPAISVSGVRNWCDALVKNRVCSSFSSRMRRLARRVARTARHVVKTATANSKMTSIDTMSRARCMW